MKFLSLVVLINLVLIKNFKINEVGIYMCVCVYIYIYLLLLSTFESNTIVETLCYWLMLGKQNAICTLCCTPIFTSDLSAFISY